MVRQHLSNFTLDWAPYQEILILLGPLFRSYGYITRNNVHQV
jgi:hypothetical protein